MSENQVAVVGAGPTGLMLACELALAGVQCQVYERRAGQPNITRAFAVHARTLELLDARGLADDLRALGSEVGELQPVPGATLSLRELDSPYPMLVIVPQSGTEKLLEARARALGVEIVRDAELTGLSQDDGGVTLRFSSGRSERAAWVAGCDGAHSAVRGLLGIDFAGRQYETHIMLADVPLAEAPAEVLFGRNNRDGLALVVPFGDGWHRVIVWDRRRADVPLSEPLTRAELVDSFTTISGTDLGMGEPRWMSRFLSERRQARVYRRGRAFLAGDAAHVHSPLGGQGMNTGIQDAMNLGWKLAAAAHGWAPAGLLDTYQAERHPVGASVLALTDAFNRLFLSRYPLLAGLRRTAIRTLLHLGPARRVLRTRLSGIGIAYPPAARGAHPWVGRRMPDLDTDRGRVYELLRGGRFVLLNIDHWGPSGREREIPDAAGAPGAGWSERVETAAPTGGAEVPPSVLVRPDGYVAWAGGRTGVADALAAWCGRPERSVIAPE
jgi:2-polyprenyl-6-methoxyphenol hydroxylase-like FAD-dependent oxidoreductase